MKKRSYTLEVRVDFEPNRLAESAEIGAYQALCPEESHRLDMALVDTKTSLQKSQRKERVS